MRNKLILFACYIFVALGCKEKKLDELSFTGKGERIFVNDNAFKQILPVDSTIKDLRFIKLETRPECLIGELNKVIKYKNIIIALDKKISKNIFLFSNEGKFIAKLFRSRNLSDETVKDVDVYNDTLFVLTSKTTSALSYYNLKGEKLGKSSPILNTFPSAICHTGNGILMYSNYTLNENLFRAISFKYDGNKLQGDFGCLPYSKSMVSFLTLGLNSYITKTRNRIVLHEFANDSLYTFNNKTGKPSQIISITFKNKGMINKLSYNEFYKNAMEFVMKKNISTIYDIYWENDRYVYFNYLAQQQEIFFLWDRKNKKVVFNAMAILSQKFNVQIPTLWFSSDKDSEILTYYNYSNIFSDPTSFGRFKKLSSIFETYKQFDNPVVCVMTIR